ncbi:SH3 domain-containing protein [Paraclostridium bifermentans]|uniref:SH3 domain-containing protein n=1 Tax=Paraclostridium bifermentans TaxID=1490 RepID=UPI003D2BAB49
MKKLLCMGAILALTSTTTIAFANDKDNSDNSLNNETQQVMPRQQAAVATGSNVNIRSNAGTSYKVIHKLNKGETFMLTNDSPKKANGYTWVKGYCKNHSGTTGWVATKYLRFD